MLFSCVNLFFICTLLHFLVFYFLILSLSKDLPIVEGSNVEVNVNNLVLSSVTRHQAGPYTCSASNVEGDARSTPLNLIVNCKCFVLIYLVAFGCTHFINSDKMVTQR